ncbi:MAG: hypothetical protein Q8L77_16155 [Nitrospirota bacterium]|nr:hypothetical protein [Nitrospirota bacterium]
MHKFSCSLVFVAGLLVVVSFGCSREAPMEKVKAPPASGNAVTEAVGEAAVGYVKTPMDKARQTEGTLERAAEQRGAEIEKATQ